MPTVEQPFDPGRRRFFRVRSGMPDAPRPPWAVDEDQFIDRCTRCDDCVRHCPEHILVKGSGGYPETDFSRGVCSYCGECAKACLPGALAAIGLDETRAWKHKASVGDGCLSHKGIVCRACGDACEAQAIKFRLMTAGQSQPLIDIKACTGCGGCRFVCPVGAVVMQLPKGSQEICPA